MREDRTAATSGAPRIPAEGDLPAKPDCQLPNGGGGGGDCCDESSSVLGCHDNDDGDGSTLFDSLSRQWVKVDNFAFAQSDNHFISR